MEDEAGWYLQKGGTLTLHYDIGTASGTETPVSARQMEIGYVKDHIFYQGNFFCKTSLIIR